MTSARRGPTPGRNCGSSCRKVTPIRRYRVIPAQYSDRVLERLKDGASAHHLLPVRIRSDVRPLLDSSLLSGGRGLRDGLRRGQAIVRRILLCSLLRRLLLIRLINVADEIGDRKSTRLNSSHVTISYA